jgi:DNA-binding transcriptional ArsR family regulator
VVLEIERIPDVAHARALYGTSRFSATPEELAVELTNAGYVERGDVEALKERLDTERVLDALSDTEWITASEVSEATDIPKGTVHKRLGVLHGAGAVERSGEGKPQHPYKWRKDRSSQPDPYVTNDQNGGPPEDEAPDWAERLQQKFGEGTAP